MKVHFFHKKGFSNYIKYLGCIFLELTRFNPHITCSLRFINFEGMKLKALFMVVQ